MTQVKVLFGNTLKKIKATKTYGGRCKTCTKNLKCCAGSTTSQFGHLRSYQPKICKKAEDKREDVQRRKEEKKPGLKTISDNKKQGRVDKCFTSLSK